MHVEWSDLVTVLVLVGLEGILSADNALVLAVLVLRLPPGEQRKALRYGILGAYALRTIATLLAVWLTRILWVTLLGALYLIYLSFKHFTQRHHAGDGEHRVPPPRILGLSAFWSTVLLVEATDLVFAVDSILVAVGLTHGDPRKTWVIIVGGILGITMMRLLTMQVLELVKRYPKLIDGAYLVISWVGFKLLMEYLHNMHLVPFAIKKEISLAVVLVLFGGSYLYARAHPAQPSAESSEAEALFATLEDGGEPRERRSPAGVVSRSVPLDDLPAESAAPVERNKGGDTS